MIRKQFPLRLAYALSVHRSQSQSMDYVVVDLSEDAFGHGQLYTALSRLRESDRLRLIINRSTQPTDLPSAESVQVKNIIYPTLILH